MARKQFLAIGKDKRHTSHQRTAKKVALKKVHLPAFETPTPPLVSQRDITL